MMWLRGRIKYLERLDVLYHCCIELDKLLELTLKGEKVLNIGEVETYQLVRELKAKGFKYFSGCNNTDKEGKCTGHKGHSKEKE